MNQLSFAALREKNVQRIPEFRNKKGEIVHTKPDGSDWLLSQWSNALGGEFGECANFIKKYERGDFTLDEGREDIAKELADIAICLDLLAFRAGVDLGQAVVDKFNEVSDRVGSQIKLEAV